MPMSSLTFIGDFATSTPITVTVPDVCSSWPVSILMRVVFPAPLGPKNPKKSPFSTVMVTSFRAFMPPKSFTMFCASMMGIDRAIRSVLFQVWSVDVLPWHWFPLPGYIFPNAIM